MKTWLLRTAAWTLCLCMIVSCLPVENTWALEVTDSASEDDSAEDDSSDEESEDTEEETEDTEFEEDELIEITDDELEEILSETESADEDDSEAEDTEENSDAEEDEEIETISEDEDTDGESSEEDVSDESEISEEDTEITITPIEDPTLTEDDSADDDSEEDEEDSDTSDEDSSEAEDDSVVLEDEEDELKDELVSEESSSSSVSYSYSTELKKFPSSYQTLLAELHEDHPDWIFIAVDTGLEWDDVVEAEQDNDLSLITTNASDLLKSNASGDYNTSTGSYIVKDSSSWVTANSAAVAYFVDPRNFLTEEYIFMFEGLSFNDAYTSSDVEAVLNGTFMSKTKSGSKITYYTTSGTKKTISKTYSSVIYSAGETYDVNPVYLAAKIRQEVGTSGSGSTSGTYTTDNGNASWAMYNGNSLDGYYNFYNIGASSSTYPVTKGLAYAAGYPDSSGNVTATSYGRPWTTPVLSITYGAKYIASSYISVGQDTSYFMRFNVNPDDSSKLYVHQYMTNIAGAASESLTTYSSYNQMDILDEVSHIFYIPVYDNMPDLDETIQISGASTTATISTSGSGVNMRAEPSSGASLVTTIPDGTEVTVIEGSGSMDTTTYTSVTTKELYPYWFQVSVTISGKTYTGYVCAEYLDFADAKTLTVGKTTTLKLTSDVDQTVYYQSSDPSVATVSASGKVTAVSAGTCEIYCMTGTKISAIGIKVKKGYDISDCTVSSVSSKTFTGEKIKPTVTVKDGSTTLTKGTDYTVSYSNNFFPGTATITITGTGQYSGTKTVTFTIKGTYYNYVATVKKVYRNGPGASYTQKGTVAKNTTVQVLDGYAKKSGSYYWYIVKINGKHYYMHSKNLKGSLTSATLSSVSSKTYTGSSIKPSVTVTFAGEKLTKGTDYTISYSNNKLPGTATITITGTGNYTGTATTTFTIKGTYYKYVTTAKVNYRSGPGTSYSSKGTLAKGKSVQVLDGYSKTANGYTWVIVKINSKHYYMASKYLKKSIASATISSISSKTFTGSSIKPSVTVKYNGTKLTKGTDYTVSYSNNKFPGTATVTITGKGDYTGSTTTTFEITGTFISYTTFAKVEYKSSASSSASAKGTVAKGKTIKILSGYSTTADGYTWYVAQISGKCYYVASSYLRLSSGLTKISKATVSSISSQSFTGSSIKPSVTVKYGSSKLKKNVDYTLSYSNNKFPGTATVTITGIGSYTGTTKVTFKITGSYQTYKTTANVYYRSGAGTSYSKKGLLSKGTKVQVLKGYSTSKNGYTWVVAKINGNYYYIAKDYLKKVS